MKKTVIVNGERLKVEFAYRVTDKMLSHQKTKRWDKHWGWLPVEISYCEAVAIIDGVEYPSIRRWHTEGGRYSEEYFYNGHFYNSHKKMIERILELSNSGEGNLPA